MEANDPMSWQNLNAENKRALLANLLAAKPNGSGQARRYPLSHAQRRLWFLAQLQPEQTAYHIPAAVKISGPLDIERLQSGLQALLARQEILRSRFLETDGEPYVVVDAADPLPLTVSRLSAFQASAEKQREEIEQHLRRLAAKPFALDTGPLFRVQLLHAAADEFILLLCLHHIIADYTSLRIMTREIAALYAGEPEGAAHLPALTVQYVDYAAWQHGRQQALQQQLKYWCEQLKALPPPLPLPFDYRRPANPSGRGMRLTWAVPEELGQRLRALARAQHCSLYATLLAALQTLLYRYTAQEDVCVGATVSNRERSETRHLIGLFVNNLVLRAHLTPVMTFRELLRQVRETTLAAFSYQDLPFEQLVEALKIERRLDRHPLFQIMFILHQEEPPAIKLPALTLSPVETDIFTTRFDLALDMAETSDGRLYGHFEFSTDLFKPATIEQLRDHFLVLLDSIARAPDTTLEQLEFLAPQQRRQLLQYQGAERPITYGCAPAMLNQTLTDHAGSTALVCGEDRLTYRQLHARASQLIHTLRALGIASGDRIALCLPRCVDLPVALLACLRLGAVYVPLDIRQPATRLERLLEQANPALALTASPDAPLRAILHCPEYDLDRYRDVRDRLPDRVEDNAIDPDWAAYLIFTSGTTGKPKGVVINHASLANLLSAMRDRPGMHPGDTLLAVTTIAFDIATLELLLPLCSGAKLVLADDDTSSDGQRLVTELQRSGITQLQATPAGWRLLLDSGWQGTSGLNMLCGGEALDADLAAQLLRRGKSLWNLYGPTETTIWSAAQPIEHADYQGGNAALPIGGVIDNTWLAVVDTQLKPLPVGFSGELLIGGAGVSPGYFRAPSLTQQKFVEVDTLEHGRQRAYRTGDRVRRRADGLIEFLGRIDNQIKLRGFRIEPGEIEAALSTHPAIAQAVVGLYTADGEQEGVLAAWFRRTSSATDAEVAPAALRTFLSALLPAYMLPSVWADVADFPLNANGKIDRRALPEPRGVAELMPGRSPQGHTEMTLAEIWSSLLPASTLTATTDFFTAGGHSLLAARMVAAAGKRLGIAVPLRLVFEQPTLAGLAQAIDAATVGAQSLPAIAVADRDGKLPLAYAQYRQWVLAQLEPDNPFYNISATVRVPASVDTELLRQSLEFVCQRHEILRTYFPQDDGQPRLQINEKATTPLSVFDLQDREPAERRRLSQAYLSAAARQPFELSVAPLLRVNVVRLACDENLIQCVVHHILADAWSLHILMRELAESYYALVQDRRPALKSLALQYADFAAWQRTLDLRGALEYWRDALCDAPVLLDLPTDFPRPATPSYRGGSVSLTVDNQVRKQLEAIAYSQGATLFMTTLAAFKCFLARYSGEHDIVVGTPVGHRPHPDLENVIGLFANTLALRTDTGACGNFIDVLQRVRATVLNAFTHQQAPFEQVLETLDLQRNWAHAPLFQVMFLWQSTDAYRADTEAPAVQSWTPWTVPDETSKFDLTLTLTESEDGLAGRLEFSSDLFRAQTVRHMADAFVCLLQGIGGDPQQPLAELPLLNQAAMRQLRHWNQTQRKFQGPGCLHETFSVTAAKQPDATAVTDSCGQISYGELEHKANALAHKLRACGVGPETRVAVCLPRTTDLVVALLAILKSGGAYVPLDPNYPPARLSLVLEDAQVHVCVTDSETVSRLPNGYFEQTGITPLLLDTEPLIPAPSGPECGARPDHAAYIIYTSGSSGRPKGVVIEHRQAVAMLNWALTEFEPAQLSGTLAATSVCFDLSVFEIFVPLAGGGRVMLADTVLHLAELPNAAEVTLINTVPTAAAELLRLGPLPASVRTVNLAGEPLPAELVRDLYAQTGVDRVYNLYGPSEDTTYSTFARLERPQDHASATGPIGLPIANTACHVLDERMQPVAIGMTGELYLSGAGVARGYWNKPALTAARFVPNPFADGQEELDTLLYRTGDRVRRLADGQMEFFGRFDQQIKLRGFRIELGEIETALNALPGVQQAVAAVRDDANGNKRLLAYLVPNAAGDTGDLNTQLRRELKQQLPDYMIPAEFILLASLPRLPNGKINRADLPALGNRVHPEPVQKPLQDPLERTLVDIWQTILNRENIGREDSFFGLGGDSILAIQAVAKIRQAGYSIAPRDIFQQPTIAALAAAIAAQEAPSRVESEKVVGRVPLTPAQHWFFSQNLAHPQYWNQSLLLTAEHALDVGRLEQSLIILTRQHDGLSAFFSPSDNGWQQNFAETIATVPLHVVRETTDNIADAVARHGQSAQSSFDLTRPPLWRLVYFELQTPNGKQYRLLIVCHHLIIDGVSWRILLDDLQTAYAAVSHQQTPKLPPRTDSCRRWVDYLQQHWNDFAAESAYWNRQNGIQTCRLPRDYPDTDNLMRDTVTHSVQLTTVATEQLLRAMPLNYKLEPEELLLTALLQTITGWTGHTALTVELENHGRLHSVNDLDLTRTVGWLTALYPITLIAPGGDADQYIREVKSQLRSVPKQGIGWGVLRWLQPRSVHNAINLKSSAEIRFNYLGQSDSLFAGAADFSIAQENSGAARHPHNARDVLIEINALIKNAALSLHWSFNNRIHSRATVEKLAADHLEHVQSLLQHCLHNGGDGLAPTDFPQMSLDSEALDDLLANL